MILITGASGFIGRRLTELLALESIDSVRCLMRSIPKTEFIWTANKIKLFYGDLLALDTIDAALTGVELVIHLAGGSNCYSLKEMTRINVVGSKNLIVACQRNCVKRIIFISTFNVTLPKLNYYALSKYEAERFIINSGMEWLVLRPSLIYGPNSSGTISQYIQALHRGSLFLMVSSGHSKLQPLHVDDLVHVIIRAIRNFDRYKMHIFNILGPEETSYLQLVHRIANYLNKKAKIIYIPYRFLTVATGGLGLFLPKFQVLGDKLVTYPMDKTGDILGLKKEFGFAPKSLEMGIKELLAL